MHLYCKLLSFSLVFSHAELGICFHKLLHENQHNTTLMFGNYVGWIYLRYWQTNQKRSYKEMIFPSLPSFQNFLNLELIVLLESLRGCFMEEALNHLMSQGAILCGPQHCLVQTSDPIEAIWEEGKRQAFEERLENRLADASGRTEEAQEMQQAMLKKLMLGEDEEMTIS